MGRSKPLGEALTSTPRLQFRGGPCNSFDRSLALEPGPCAALPCIWDAGRTPIHVSLLRKDALLSEHPSLTAPKPDLRRIGARRTAQPTCHQVECLLGGVANRTCLAGLLTSFSIASFSFCMAASKLVAGALACIQQPCALHAAPSCQAQRLVRRERERHRFSFWRPTKGVPKNNTPHW